MRKSLGLLLLALVLCTAVLVSCGGKDECAHAQTSVTREDKTLSTCTEGGRYDIVTACSDCGVELDRKEGISDPLLHDEVTHEAKAPTCTEPGYKEYHTCTRCDFSTLEELPALGHIASEIKEENVIAPSCTEEGSCDEVVYCTECETEISRTNKTLEKLDHNTVSHEAKAPTCTEIGYNAYFTCVDCDYTTYEELPALGHKKTIIGAKAPTCTEIGWDKYITCERCDYTTYEEIPALGHEEVTDESVAPTCTSVGLTEGKHCSRCKEILLPQTELPMAAHTYDNKLDEYCNVCGFLRNVKCEHENTLTILGYAPTCTATGLTDGVKCSECEEILTKQAEIPALSHDEIPLSAKAPTCTEIGWDAYVVCARCNYTTYKEIAPHGHKGGDAVRENETLPTCTTGGSYDEVVYCTECKTELSRSETNVSALGHTLTVYNDKAPGCTTDGYTDYKECSVCDYMTMTVVPAKGHNKVTDARVEPGCTVTGLTEGEHCSVCGTVLKEQTVIPATGHSKKTEEGKAPTCTESGYTEREYCSVCNETIKKSEFLSAVGHNYVGGSCALCGKAEPTEYSEGLKFVSYNGTNCFVSGIGNCEDTVISIPPISPEGYKVIGIEYSAFANNKNITEVIIPDGVLYVGENAFSRCDNLEKVTMPEGLEEIGNGAFMHCIKLNNVVIPETVFLIGSEAFRLCYGITSIVIPDSVTVLGDLAFADSGIKTVYIGSSVSSLGYGTFRGCTDLVEITVSRGNASYKSEDGNLYSFDLTVLIQYSVGKTDASFIIPNTATKIESSAFSYANNLTSVTIPEGVKTLGDYAFSNCNNLTEVTLPGSIESMGAAIFKGCSGLKKVTLSLGIKIIANDTFDGCISLEIIIIPSSLIYVGDGAFNNCQALVNIRFHGSEAEWGSVVIGSGNDCFTGSSVEWNHTHTPTAEQRENVIDSDCTTPGSYEAVVYCSGCSEELSRINKTIDPKGHNGGDVVKENENAASCKNGGSYDEVVYCTECNAEISRTEKTTPAVGHNYVDGECTECGEIKPLFVRCDKNGTPNENGNYVFFGEYPQTVKLASVTITDIKDSRGYYLGSDGEYYAKATARPYEHGNGPTRFANKGLISKGAEYYFKVEPIRWRILEERGGKLFLSCDVVLMNMDFFGTNSSYSNNYKNSMLRSWMNKTFFNAAFDENQKAMVLTTNVNNSITSTPDTENPNLCEDTEDKLFLLSYNEVTNSAYGFTDATRALFASDYARAMGTYIASEASSYFGQCEWWLRTPGNAAGVSNLRSVGMYGQLTESSAYFAYVGIVPAMWIQIEDHTHTPAEAVVENNVPASCTNSGSYDEVIYCSDCGEELERTAKSTPATGHNYEGGVCTACGEKEPGYIEGLVYVRDGNYIYFGEYPQTIKADNVTIDLNTRDSRGYYLGSDGYYYAAVTATPADSIYTFTNNVTVVSGAVYYFKVEPIRWRILEEKNGEALLLCDFAVTAMSYDSLSNNYKDSDIRAWLNGEFYNTAFNSLQKEIILITNVDNSKESTGIASNSYACENTDDKVFLLSFAEVTNRAYGFSEFNTAYNVERMIKPSDFAISKGIYVHMDSTYSGNSSWWLRSPVSDYYRSAQCVEYGGNANGRCGVGYNDSGVVPALKIKANDSPEHIHTLSGMRMENTVHESCTEDGSYESVIYCLNCGEELERTLCSIPATGHNYEDGVCTRCGENDPKHEDKPLYVRDGNYIYFGEYPQTIKADDVTIDLNTRDSRGYYLGSDGYYYAAVTATPCEMNYKFTNNTTVLSGNVYYFKVEPIRWRILEEKNGEAFLLCDSIIANVAYQSSYGYNNGCFTPAYGAPSGTYANNYKYSEVRHWLNNEFYQTAFSELQKEIILITEVDNSAESTSDPTNKYACENTNDKVFLLSYQDITNSAYGFNAYYGSYDPARNLKNSDYSRATGAWTIMFESYYGNGMWWLRTPSASDRDSDGARNVHYTGEVIAYTLCYEYAAGVAPSIRIKVGDSTVHTHTTLDAVKENNVPASCTVGGSYDSVIYCSDCGEEIERTSLSTPAPGHNYEGGVCTICGAKESGYTEKDPYYRDGNYIYFGEYPQTIKADNVTIDLNTRDSRGYYLGSDGYYYAAVTATPYKASFKFTNDITIVSGEVYYFKVEPIRWRILEEKNGEAFLLCDFIIESKAYDSANSNNYKDSDIRAWLNAEFYNTAFTALEREIILTTNVDNSASSTDKSTNSYACENTDDKVFLLSYQEAINSAYGFSSNAGTYDDARLMQTSDYSRASGATMVTNNISYYGIGYWWLRSPYYNNSNYAYAILRGYLYHEVAVGNSHYSVVPAIRIKL